MFVIGVDSVRAGAGASLVSAVLAAELCASGARTLLTEAAPQICGAGLYFGLELGSPEGWRNPGKLLEDLYRMSGGPDILPAGGSRLESEPEFRHANWQELLGSDDYEFTIIDLGDRDSKPARHFLPMLNLTISVFEPDMNSLARICTGELRSSEYFLVNKYLPESASQSDVLAFMHSHPSLGSRLIDTQLLWDEFAQLSTACKQPVNRAVEGSQTSRGAAALLLWIKERRISA